MLAVVCRMCGYFCIELRISKEGWSIFHLNLESKACKSSSMTAKYHQILRGLKKAERHTYFSSIGKSKNAFPSVITCSISSSGIPVFFMYKNPTSRRAWRSSTRKPGFVAESLARERSRTGTELKDDILMIMKVMIVLRRP